MYFVVTCCQAGAGQVPIASLGSPPAFPSLTCVHKYETHSEMPVLEDLDQALEQPVLLGPLESKLAAVTLAGRFGVRRC